MRVDPADPRPRVFAVTTDLALTGAKRVLVDGAVGIDRRRFRPGVLLLSPVDDADPLRRELAAAGVDVHHVRVRSRLDVRGLLDLRAWVRDVGRPDVLHTHCARSAGVVRLVALGEPAARRPRVVVHFHGTVSARALRWKHRLLDRVVRGMTSMVVAPTLHSALRGARVHAYRGMPVRVVPNGIDFSRIARAARSVESVRRSWGVPEGTRVVLLLGRWGAAKGHDVLLDAIPAVLAHPEPVRFVLVAPEGGGEYRSALERMVRRTALRRHVVFTGRDTDPGSCYAAADVVTVPSRDEPFGLVAVEAMAAGRTLVAARAGGLPEVCGDRAGVLWVEPGDPDALARALLTALEEPAGARDARAVAARSRATDFALGRYIAHLESVYAEVLRRPDLAPPGGRPAGARDVSWPRGIRRAAAVAPVGATPAFAAR